MESVTNAKGRWPLRASGIPTTQHSATCGWEEIACSMDPGAVLAYGHGESDLVLLLTSAEPMGGHVDDII